MNDGTSEYQWLKLCKIFFHLKKDVYLCLIYFAPTCSVNLLEMIEKDINDKYRPKGDIIITGVLNARTASVLVYIINDTTTHIPINNYQVDQITERRVSQDKIVDSRCKELIDLCIGNQLRILNGRCCGNTTGKYTCFKPKGSSVVDYCLASETLLSEVLYMHVSEFIPKLSDCHCKISLKLLAHFEREYSNETGLTEFPSR